MPPKRAPLPTAEITPREHFSLRVPERVTVVAEELAAEIGLGDRSEVIRLAVIYGLDVFRMDKKKLRAARTIKL